LKTSLLRWSFASLFAVLLFPVLSSAATYPDLPVSKPMPEPALPGNFDSFTPPVSGGANSGAPVFAEWTKSGAPNDALVMAGQGLSSFVVFGQTIGYNGTVSTPQTDMQDGLKSQIILGSDLPANAMYLVWSGNGAGYGTPAAINKTELWWVGPDQAGPGDTIAAFGRNLAYGSVAPAVYVKPANASGSFATVTSYGGGKISFTVPSFASGTYEVWVHNGHGGHYGWSGPGSLTIRPSIAYTGTVFNVKNYGAGGTGGDDTAAIQSALNAAASAGQGSVVYFPAGIYGVDTALQPASGLQLKGDGMASTTLKLTPGFSSYGMIFQDQPGWSSNLQVNGMTLDAAGNYNNASINAIVRLRNQSNVQFINSAILSDQAQQFDFTGSDHLQFQGCNFTGSGAYLATARQVFMDHCNFYGEYQDLATAELTMQSGGDFSITSSVGQNLSDANPGCGRFVYLEGGFGSWRHFYMENCQTYNMAPSMTKSDQNSGEQVLWEANASAYTGQAVGGSANTVVLPQSGGWAGGSYTAVIENGTGMGQYRTITGDSGTGTLTVSPAWNVPPDATSLVMVGYVFADGYCTGNSLQGRSDYATRITASTGFEPYSGTMDIVLDNNTVTQCRQGITNFAIMDKAAGAQPNYWFTCTRNDVSNCLHGILTQYSQWSGSSAQGASAVFAADYDANTLSNMTHDAVGFGDYDSNANPGTMDANLVQHNTASFVPAGLVGTGGLVRTTLDYQNSFSSGSLGNTPSPTVTPVNTPANTAVAPTATAVPATSAPTATSATTPTLGTTAGTSPASTSTPGSIGSTLPCPWSQSDIGNVGLAGSASVQSGVWTVTGAGSDIYGSPDSFHMVWQPVSGDATLVARVTSLQNTNFEAKAGVMIRQNTAANSTFSLSNLIAGDHEVEFISRAAAGGPPTSTAIGGGLPYWVKVVRAGSLFTGYASPDGVTWTQVSSAIVSMSDPMVVGLVVCSHDTTQLCTATFDNVSLTGNQVAPCLTSPTLGATQVPPTATRTPTATPTSTPTASPSMPPTSMATPGTGSPTAGASPMATPTAAPAIASGWFFLPAPNPASSFTIFYWNQSRQATASITVQDPSGQTVASANLPGMPAGSNQTTMNLNNVASGSYTATLSLSSGSKPNRQTKLAVFK
jgi:hypothetical protein